MNLLRSLAPIALLFLSAPVFAQEITIGSDGIVRCKDVPDGTSQVIGLDTYEVAHSATKVRERFLYGQDVTKLCVSNITDMSGLFDIGSGVNNFNQDISTWDVSNVTRMDRLFKGAASFTHDLNSWDVSSVTTTADMFRGATAFNGDISSWQTSRLLKMSGMFSGATSFNQNIGAWNTSSVTEMDSLFTDATAFNQDIGGWDVSSVADMYRLFAGAESFNQDIGSWDVSKAQNLAAMFRGATSFNQDIGGWDVSAAENIGAMFMMASSFNADISSWDVSSVTNFSTVFQRANSFNGDISAWDVSNAQLMIGTFWRNEAFNGDISTWDVSSVTDMRLMFSRSVFNGDIRNWDVSSVQNMSEMFTHATMFDQDISGWNVTSVSDMRYMFFGATIFRQNLSSWCVPLITAVPINFATETFIQSLLEWHPKWGCNVAPNSSLQANPVEGIAPLVVVFDASASSDPNGDALTYTWDFKDGSAAMGATPIHSFAAGTYEVTLTVSDGELTASETITITATNTAPVANILASVTDGLYPLEVSFDASGSTDANGDALTYAWDFKDGTTSTDVSPTHTFAAGTYDVTLIVSDGVLADTATVAITATNAAPVASASASTTQGQAPYGIDFNASASTDPNGDALTFAWDFGDGATGSGETVSHIYTAAGEYTVVLTASDGHLTGTDSLTVSIASGVDTESFELPESFALKAAYPNPFNPTTTITYGLPVASEVRLTATDLLGRQVATLVAGDMKAAGYHTIQFDAGGLASGTYLIRMEAGDFVATQQVVLLK